MTIYKSKWYVTERMSTGKYYIRQDLGTFKNFGSAHDSILDFSNGKSGCENLAPYKGDYILQRPHFRLTRSITVNEADAITQAWIEEHVDFERASLSYLAYPRKRPSELTDYVPDYEWAWDKVMGDIWTLVELDVADFKPGEGDWEAALQYQSTRQYIEWFKEGHRPPPLFVVRHVDGDLVSLNRRRWLAAREAGIKSLLCYYCPTTEHGRPAWERKLCTWDHAIICTHRRTGGDCTNCPQRPK